MKQPLITIEMFQQNREFLNKIYDAIRLIDPFKHKLIVYDEMGGFNESDFHCYSHWKNKKICENCVSMKAFTHRDTFFRLQCKNKKIYMVTAIPIQCKDDVLILELLKDVSKNFIVDESEFSGNEILDMLNIINQQQTRDSLTGIFNRRYMEDRLPIDIANTITGDLPLSIIFADIDRFKNVNDTYGHVAGDHVLKSFAQVLTASMENVNGWVARYGGEEFLLVIMGANMDTAFRFAEKVRKRIQRKKIIYKDMEIKITSSFGVTSLEPGTATTSERLIDAADKHLYTAKVRGRNKVISGTFK